MHETGLCGPVPPGLTVWNRTVADTAIDANMSALLHEECTLVGAPLHFGFNVVHAVHAV